MALFAISDLHLSLGTDKPMYVFGDQWKDYESKLRQNWLNSVSDEDFVIINGDNSWATYLENTKEDFSFINSLPGKKILSKGNHDYWWTTMKKMNDFCRENIYDTISFLQNNHYMYGDIAICGTRGWQLSTEDEKDLKIHNREIERLKLSFNSAKKSNPAEIIVALHYPPDDTFKALMEKYDVKQCFYGHLHGQSHRSALNGKANGIKYQLVSCDFLDFKPFKIC